MGKYHNDLPFLICVSHGTVSLRLAAVVVSCAMQLMLVLPGVASDSSAKAYVLCKSQKSVRTIRIIENSDKSGCKAYYTKEGHDNFMGGGKDFSICQNVLNKIRRNLQDGGWKCRDVSRVSVYTTPDSQP